MVFGECGQGKSTTLNQLVEILQMHYPDEIFVCNFESKESFNSVTACVQFGTAGDMTLIDTPGFNDPD